MAEKKSFDPKDHAVLGHWPEANYACLMLNGANDKKFVAAYGYDPEAKDWSQGHYFATASEAWNHADPEVIEKLSEPVRVRDVMSLFEDAGIEGAGREDALEYAGNCCMAINSADHSSYDPSWSHEIEDVREWWDGQIEAKAAKCPGFPPSAFYQRPERLCAPDADGQGIALTDKLLDEVWSWREKEELAAELSYQLDPDGGNAEPLATFACWRDEAKCRSLFEHVWPAYYDLGKAESITKIAREGISDWLCERHGGGEEA